MSTPSNASPKMSSVAKRKERDWSEENEKYVKRYDFWVFIEELDKWSDDVKELNAARSGPGHPYEYPESIILLGLMFHFLYRVSYRGAEGMLRTICRLKGIDKVPDYTTLYRRGTSMDVSGYFREHIPMENVPLIVAVDSTGIKIDNYSEWMRHKWGSTSKKRRGWIKVHLVVNTSTHVPLDVKITDEHVGDQAEFIPLLESCLSEGYTIKQALGDGIYDTREIFNFLGDKGISPGIPPRKNASTRSRGCPLRAQEVRFVVDYGEKRWKKTRGYSARVAVERTFGGFKRVFGDWVQSRKWENVVWELKAKFSMYGYFLTLGAGGM